MATTFTDSGYPNPLLNPLTAQRTSVIKRILKTYRDQDPTVQHQLAIPFDIIKQITSHPAENQTTTVWQQLTLFAYFFALRPCEYLKVGSNNTTTLPERRTCPLRKRNIRFWRNHKLVPHSDPNLRFCDAVTVDFVFQKSLKRNESVTLTKNGNIKYCPVVAAATRITHMQCCVDNGTLNDESFLFSYIENNGKQGTMTDKVARTLLRHHVSTTDYITMGLDLQRIGLHSLRASSAMGMYLNGVPFEIIKLIGRWASDAFLRYLRPMIEQFNQNVSALMIQTPVYHRIRPPQVPPAAARIHNGPHDPLQDALSPWAALREDS